MASRVSRLWTTFLGGGSVLLGVGLLHHGFKNSDRRLLNNCLCESQNIQNDITCHFSEKQWEVETLLLIVVYSGSLRAIYDTL